MFRDLHDNDPLQRKFDQPRLAIKGLFQNRPFSSASSAAPFSYRTSAAPMSSRSSSYRPGSGVARPANVTEAVDEGDEAELAEGQNDEEYVEGIGQLEEVLQAEQAEQEGVDASILQDLEHGIEAAAGALVTMREARQALVIVRGDRGYMASWEMEAKVVARNPRRFPLGRWQPVPQSWSWCWPQRWWWWCCCCFGETSKANSYC